MSDIAILPTPARANARTDAARPRDAQPSDAGPASFATLLGAALAPAARPLTRPVAAGADGTASEGSASGEAATAEGADAGATATTGGAAMPAAPATGAMMESGGAPADAAARAAAAAHGIYRGTDALAPELRERLGRVVERMKAEHGHDVRVTETFRSQARQDGLHAQGRTAAGPVVTWTRSSNHTLGRAADVIVNGTYDDPAAYATLQRIAREEGLHTLGMRDPGHLELPKAVGGRVDLAELARLGETPGLEGLRVESVHVEGDDAFAATPGRVAQVAAVAPVAQVAAVAQVAQVATPGLRRAAAVARATAATGVGSVTGASSRDATVRVGGGPAAHRASSPAAATSASVAAGEARTAHSAIGGGTSAGERTRAGRERTGREDATDATTSLVDSATGAAAQSRGDGLGVAASDPVARAERVETVDHLARLDRIAALRDSAAQRPLSHLTLTLDNAAGGADRIRVGMRGTSVGATLELSDAAQAERMTAHIGELQQALEARGLDADGLQVRRAGAATEPAEVARVTGAVLEREALRSGASSSAQSQSQSQQQNPQSQASLQREREERAARDGSQHEDPSSSRHRSRREHQAHQEHTP